MKAHLGEILGAGTTAWAAATIEAAYEAGDAPEWTDTAGFAIGLIGIVVAGVAAALNSLAGAVASLLFDGASFIIDGLSLVHEPGLENLIIAAIDGSTVAIDAHTFGLPI